MCWFSWFGKSHAFGIEGNLGLNVTFASWSLWTNQMNQGFGEERKYIADLFFLELSLINLGWGSNLNNHSNRVTQKKHHLSCFHLLESRGCFRFRNYSCIYSLDKASSGNLCAVIVSWEIHLRHSVELGWEDKLQSRNKYEKPHRLQFSKNEWQRNRNIKPTYFVWWPIIKMLLLFF